MVARNRLQKLDLNAQVKLLIAGVRLGLWALLIGLVFRSIRLYLDVDAWNPRDQSLDVVIRAMSAISVVFAICAVFPKEFKGRNSFEAFLMFLGGVSVFLVFRFLKLAFSLNT